MAHMSRSDASHKKRAASLNRQSGPLRLTVEKA